ncbi:MAG: hypothetical protein QXH05_05180 [Thermosphaera sp.]
MDFYYATYCANGIPLEVKQSCGEYFRNSIKDVRLAVRTIAFLNDLLKREGIEYVYVKTYRPIPYAPSDIDILIRDKDFEHFIRLLNTYGFKIVQRGVEVRCFKKNMTRIDVYSSIIYAGIAFEIIDQIFSKRTYVKFLGDYNILIPSPELDALVVLLHDVLGHKTMNYLDYHYIKYYLLSNPANKTVLEFLHSMARGADLIKRCIALFLSLERKGAFENIKDFPIMFTPPLLLSMMIDFSPRKKILYSSSFLVDVFLRFYNFYKDAIPEKLKRIVQVALFYYKLLIGDRHTSWRP